MKKLLFLFSNIISVTLVLGQGLSVNKLVDYLTTDPNKIDKLLDNKNFFYTGKEHSGDTTLKIYRYKPELKGKERIIDSVLSVLPSLMIMSSQIERGNV